MIFPLTPQISSPCIHLPYHIIRTLPLGKWENPVWNTLKKKKIALSHVLSKHKFCLDSLQLYPVAEILLPGLSLFFAIQWFSQIDSSHTSETQMTTNSPDSSTHSWWPQKKEVTFHFILAEKFCLVHLKLKALTRNNHCDQEKNY